jgi:hypothetical protein
VSEIRFRPGDPKRRTRSVTIGPVLGAVLAPAETVLPALQ